MNAGERESIINEVHKVSALKEELEGTIVAKRNSNSRRNANTNALFLDPDFLAFAETLYQKTLVMLEERLVYLDAQLAYLDSPAGNAPVLERFDYNTVTGNIKMLSAVSRLRSDEITAEKLIEAINAGDIGMVALLIHLGLDPSADDNEALKEAVFLGFTNIVALLLSARDAAGEQYVDPTEDDNYAIRTAAKKGYVDMVALLLADPRVDPTEDDNFALSSAIENGHTEVVALLLSARDASGRLRIDPRENGNFAFKNSNHK